MHINKCNNNYRAIKNVSNEGKLKSMSNLTKTCIIEWYNSLQKAFNTYQHEIILPILQKIKLFLRDSIALFLFLFAHL